MFEGVRPARHPIPRGEFHQLFFRCLLEDDLVLGIFRETGGGGGQSLSMDFAELVSFFVKLDASRLT